MSTKKTTPQQVGGLCSSFSQFSLDGTAKIVPSVKSYKEAALAHSALKENSPPRDQATEPKACVTKKEYIASLLETLKIPNQKVAALMQIGTLLLRPERKPLVDITRVVNVRSPDHSVRMIQDSPRERYCRESFVANLKDLIADGRFEAIQQLVQGVLVDKLISLYEAYTLSAQILSLSGEPIDSSSLDSLRKDVEGKFRAFLLSAQQRCVNNIEKLASIHVYEYCDLRRTLLPVAISSCITLPSGRVNIGILPLVLQAFLTAPGEWDGIEAHIARLGRDLASDPDVVRAIETIPSIAENTLGHRLVNTTLLRSHQTPVLAADARCAAIVAILTFWRQNDAVNCCPNSLVTQRQGIGMRWFVEDIKSLLVQGYITRTFREQEIRFVGAEASEPIALDSYVANMSCITDSWVVKTISEHLRASRQHLDIALQERPHTLRKLFEILHTRWPQIYPKEAFTHIQFVIEAPIRCALLAVLENAIGSSYSAPLSTEFGTSASLQWNMYKTVLTIFRELATTHDLNGIRGIIDIALEGLAAETLPSKYCGVVLLQLQKYRLDWMVSQKECTTSSSPGVTQICLEEGPGFKPVKRIEFAVRLYNIFISLYVQAYGQTTTPSSINVTLMDTLLANQQFLENGSREEQGMPNHLPSMGMQQANAKIWFCKAKSPKSFLLWLQRFRIGKDPNLSLLGISAHHQFRFLPQHPSLPFIDPTTTSNSLTLIENKYRDFGQTLLQGFGDKALILDRLTEITAWLVRECGRRVSFKNLPGIAIKIPEAQSIKICDRIIGHIDRYYPSLTVSSVNQAIQKMIMTEILDYLSMDTARFGVMRRDELNSNCRLSRSNEEMHYHVFSVLLGTQSLFRNLLLHFADSNYTAVFSQKQYAVHICMWFNQFSNNWTVVHAVENNQWHPAICVLPTTFNELGMVDSFDDIRKEVERRREMGYAS